MKIAYDGHAVSKRNHVLDLFIWSLFFPGLALSAASPPASEEAGRYFVLENGIQVALIQKSGIPLANISAAVGLGTKDEPEGAKGIVHLLEHCLLFRGTEFRSGMEVSRDIRNNGAYFNAHTGQDTATFEISLPSDRIDFALANQKEILFHFDIDEEDLDKEKAIILEEIALIQDDPRKMAASIVYRNLFAGHPYESPVYGSVEDIKAVRLEQVRCIYKKHFVPGNCSLAVVGEFDLGEMENKIRAVFGPVKGLPFQPAKIPRAELLRKDVEVKEEMDVHEAYLVIGMVAPDYNHPDRFAVDLLTEILGRGLNPLLYAALRTRWDLVQTVSMDYVPFQFGGLILISFTLEPKNVVSAKSAARGFLKKIPKLNFSSDDYWGEDRFIAFDHLKSAQLRFRFNFEKGREVGLAISSSLARHMLLHEKTSEVIDVLKKIEMIDSTDLRKAAAKYLSKGKPVVVSILPSKKR